MAVIDVPIGHECKLYQWAGPRVDFSTDNASFTEVTIVGDLDEPEEMETFDVNIRGTWQLLEACRRNPTIGQVVMASTDKVYGDQVDLPYHEGMPLNAVYPHDVSKACAEMVARSYAETYGLNVAFTRLPNLYGPGDLNWSRIIPGTIRSALLGEAPVIHELQRVSKPGLRRYVKAREIPRVKNGLGMAILSTPKGLMSDRDARRARVGGELVAVLW